jgi:dienelactone hydrolase
MRIAFLLVAGLLSLLPGGAAQSEITQIPGLVREPLPLPVTLDGKEIILEGLLTRPDGPGRFPVAIISHGAPRLSSDIPLSSPERFSAVAIDFARRGWAAAVILRRGYGRSGGTVAEDSGPCGNRDYARAANNSADDVTAIVQALRTESWADPDRILLVGHSAGGFASLAAAARQPAGIVGVLNFAGGRGSIGPDNECQPDRLIAVMAALGRTTTIPSLWIYAENDRYFGPDLARSMFDAYAAHGAPTEFFAAPPFGEDGHALFLDGPDIWREPVEKFLGKLNLPFKYEIDLAEPSVPRRAINLGQAAYEAFRHYLASTEYEKAFATGLGGHFGYSFGNRTMEDAEADALKRCAKVTSNCSAYASGNSIIN